MKKSLLPISLACLASASSLLASDSTQLVEQTSTSATTQEAKPNANLLSIRQELKLAIQRGNKYLKTKQHEDGYWYDEKLPAFTALAVYAAMGDPNREKDVTPDYIKKGYKYIESKAHKDGGIYGKGLATYNTSLSIMALAASGDPAHRKLIVN